MALAGLDLEFAEQTAGEVRQQLILRLGRLCERERIRSGLTSYDLARHCALARIHSRLSAAPQIQANARNKNGGPKAAV